MLLWDLFEDHHLFDGSRTLNRKQSDVHLLAEIEALLGPPPPLNFFGKYPRSQKYWDSSDKIFTIEIYLVVFGNENIYLATNTVVFRLL